MAMPKKRKETNFFGKKIFCQKLTIKAGNEKLAIPSHVHFLRGPNNHLQD